MNGIIPVAIAVMVHRSERDLDQYQQNPLAARAMVAARQPRIRFGPIATLTATLRNRLSWREAEPVTHPRIGERRQASMS